MSDLGFRILARFKTCDQHQDQPIGACGDRWEKQVTYSAISIAQIPVPVPVDVVSHVVCHVLCLTHGPSMFCESRNAERARM